MTKLMNFYNWANIAKNSYGLKTYANEWNTAMWIVIAAKLVTMYFSIFAGYYYLYDALINVFEPIYARTISIILLFIIEILNSIFLSKFFKFALRYKTHYLTAISLFIVVSFLFAGSFVISTNGLAAKQAGKADKTEILTNDKASKIKAVETATNTEIQRLQKQIETIERNPVWSNGKLSSNQQKNIANYNTAILNLIDKKATEIQAINSEFKAVATDNKNKMQATAKRFYSLMSILMIVQVFSTGYYIFSLSRIYNENDKNALLKEQVQATVKNVTNLLDNQVNSELSKYSSILASVLQYNNTQSTVQSTPTASNGQTTVQQKNKIGFKPITEPLNDKAPLNGERLTVDSLSPKKPTNKHCKHCNTVFSAKHWNAQYCSETCRISAWEGRTGAKFTKKATK